MEDTIKYADSSALKWQVQDFDCSIESMLDSEEINEDTFVEMLSLDESVKLEIIESAIDGISSHLCEIIFEAIREQIQIKLENNG